MGVTSQIIINEILSIMWSLLHIWTIYRQLVSHLTILANKLCVVMMVCVYVCYKNKGGHCGEVFPL